MVRQDRFRKDLYYRIHVVPIFVPALRERVEDIPVLVEYFLGVYSAANGMQSKRIADDAMLAMRRYAWPGNVRELQNAIQRLVVMTEGELISLQDLPAEILQAAGSATGEKLRLSDGGINLDREMEAFEKRWVQEALEEAKQVKSEAAHMLGVDRNRMNYLCRKYKL
jgi:DNA-binding NtrC family response regulator